MDASFPAKCALDDPRLAAHATGAAPAWLFSPDGGRVLWANAAGCAVFTETDPRAFGQRIFAPGDPVRLEIARISVTLAQDSAPRHEYLSGLSGQAPSPPMLPYACSLIGLGTPDDNDTDGGGRVFGVLVVAPEAQGEALPLAERVARLDLDRDGAIAAFTPEGRLLFATESAKRRFGPAEDLAAIGAQSLAATALLAGAAAGPVATGEAKFVRLGTGSDTVLLGYLDNAHPANKAEREGACATMADEGEDGIALALSPPLTDTAAPGRDQGASEPSPEDTASACGDAVDAAEGSAAMAVAEDEPRPRPLPARFTWQMDAGGRFTLGSDEFTEIIGTRIAIALGRPWQEINAELGLDPEDCFRRAADTRETFSNVTVSWPVENYPERLDVALAGLPVFGRDRNFLGYRGFGLCRDADRIENLRTMRRLALFGTPPTIAGAKPTAGRAAAATILGPFGEAIARQEMPPPLPQENVVRFPEAASANARPGAAGSPSLSAGEHHAFHEIARHLTARLENRAIPPAETLHNPSPAALTTTFPARDPAGAGLRTDSGTPGHRPPLARFWNAGLAHARSGGAQPAQAEDHALLNRLHCAILVSRLDELLFANPAFLALTGYRDLDTLAAAGGLDALFVSYRIGALADTGGDARTLVLARASGGELPVEGRLFAITWGGEPAIAVVLARSVDDERVIAAESARRQAETQARELRLLLEAATDAILVIDTLGVILSSDRGSEILFGRHAGERLGGDFATLFAPQSHRDAAACLAQAQRSTGHAEAVLTVRTGGPARVTIKRLAADNSRFGVAVRTVANAAAAFAPASAGVAHTETGTVPPPRLAVDLNEAVTDAVSQLRSDASAARIIIRTSLLPALCVVSADAATLAKMVTTLLRHALSTSPPGNQIIVSTRVRGDGGEVSLRVRDGDGGSGNDTPAMSRVAENREVGSARPATGFLRNGVESGRVTKPAFAPPGEALRLVRALADANDAAFRVIRTGRNGSLYELRFAAGPAVAG